MVPGLLDVRDLVCVLEEDHAGSRTTQRPETVRVCAKAGFQLLSVFRPSQTLDWESRTPECRGSGQKLQSYFKTLLSDFVHTAICYTSGSAGMQPRTCGVQAKGLVGGGGHDVAVLERRRVLSWMRETLTLNPLAAKRALNHMQASMNHA